MGKSFKKDDPNKAIMNKSNNTEAPEPKEIEVEPKAPDKDILPTTTPKKQEKKKPEYLRLDVTEYKDYVSLMAEHTSNTTGKYVSMTQYILRLIEADKQKNIETYEKLEQIERMKRELM